MGWIDRDKESFVHAPLAWVIQQLYSHCGITFDDEKLKEYFHSYHPDPNLDSNADAETTINPRPVRFNNSQPPDRCLPWATGHVAHTSAAILAVMGKKVRRLWKVKSSQIARSECGGRMASTSQSTQINAKSGSIVASAVSDIQVHIGAREYKEPNAVPGYTLRLPVGGQLHWVRKSCARQPPRGVFFGKFRSRSSGSSTSRELDQSAAVNSKESTELPGSGSVGRQNDFSHCIHEAPVGSLEAQLLNLPDHAVSAKPCCTGL
ncbi:hypothetical protein ACLX1H_006036 [Fusarium chlamydosporum]